MAVSGWPAAAHQYSADHAVLENAVQIIVPELCLSQDTAGGHLIDQVSSNVDLVEPAVAVGAYGDGCVKDSLSALVAAAELDQVQTDLLPKIGDRPPFLEGADRDANFYSEIYHYLTSCSFPESSSEATRKAIKKRATHYSVNENGTLSYGSKNPKFVVTNREEQIKILFSAHVNKDTKVHLGVRKMYNMIFAKYYWRSLYVDIGEFVRNCKSCSEVSFQMDNGQVTDIPPVERLINVWKRVRVNIHGPYEKTANGNEYLISMVDLVSKWVLARPSIKEHVENNCASFIFESFCSYGFAQCQVVGVSCHFFEAMQLKYRERFDSTQDILRTLVPFDSEDTQSSFMFTLHEELSEECWTGEMFDEMAANNPTTWDEEVARLLFAFSTAKPLSGGPSPFAVMFARTPTGYMSEEDKENFHPMEEEEAQQVSSNRRKLKSSTLQCRHCYETFTSKISFRIHQRKHTEDARRRGTLDGEERRSELPLERRYLSRFKKRQRQSIRDNAATPSMSSLPWNGINLEPMPNSMTQSTVEAVKNLLMATKEERSKRGKYFKYTPELRDEIAQYALDHSIPAATTYWTSRLGNTVSESSIRNFIKTYKSFSSEKKEEIGKYAFNHGIERAALHFREKLGFEIRRGSVVKFKKYYMKKFSDLTTNESDFSLETPEPKRSHVKSRQKRYFSFQIKEEIGRFASENCISAAMQHFSVKLQFPVKESTVRKFRRQYLERNPSANEEVGDHSAPHDAIDAMQSLSVMNSGPNSSGAVGINVSVPNNFMYQHSYSPNMTQPGGAVIPINNAMTFHQGSVNQGITSISYQQAAPTVIMNQPFPQMASSSFQQGYISGFGQGNAMANHLQGAPPVSSSSVVPQSNSSHHLAMGGPHLPPPNIFHQMNSANYNQPPSGSLTFESTIGQQPLSLMKDASQGMQDGLQNADHVEAAIVHIPNSTILEPHSVHVVQTQPQLIFQTHSNEPISSNQQQMQSQHQEIGVKLDPPVGNVANGCDEDGFNRPKRRKKKGKVKYYRSYRSSYTCGKRGNYVSYSPELRADIGKYAAEQGNLQAITYFKEKMGIDIPESTVRGLKDKYIMKRIRGEKEVKSLGFAQRGRPMRLGKYDAVVQQCIRELTKSGEKVSSFLVIATAKQVLMQYEPSLLQENGGPVKLNPTWAKSFLKRIGLSHLN